MSPFNRCTYFNEIYGQAWLPSKYSAHNAGDAVLIPGSGSFPGEGNGYPLQYSGLENSMSRGAWKATIHGVPKSWTGLSDYNWDLEPFCPCRKFHKAPL